MIKLFSHSLDLSRELDLIPSDEQSETILIECPHSLKNEEEVRIYTSKIETILRRNLIPLLMPESHSEEECNLYLPYGKYLWRWNHSIELNPLYLGSFEKIYSLNNENSLIGLFTSGSTGRPKLIWHRISHYIESAHRSAELLNLNHKSKILSTLPCYHNGGLLNLVRASLYEHPLKVHSHKELLQVWRQWGPDIVIGVPTQLQQALEDNCFREGQIFYSGGAALNEDLWRQALQNKLKVYGTYGLTESCGAILYKEFPEDFYHPMRGITISMGTENNLCFESPSNALGIQRDQEITFFRGPWQTADLMECTDKGIILHGRTDQMIICSGENIDPKEIETHISLYMKKNKLNYTYQILGFPDPIKGQIPVVVIESLDKWPRERFEEFKSFLKKNISPLKCPRFILSRKNPLKGIKLTSSDLPKLYDQEDKQRGKI